MNVIPKIFLVLRTGGEYDYKYVNNIAEAIKKNTSIDTNIVCLTNDPSGISNKYVDEIVLFNHDWPKWWGKVELFRPDLHEDNDTPKFFFDLDTFVVDNIDEYLSRKSLKFSGLQDFYNLESFASGLLYWKNPMTEIYEMFKSNPNRFMKLYEVGGDQSYISQQFHHPKEFLQDSYPKQIVSYKVHCKVGGDIILPKDAKIVCFHGKPKPHTINSNLAKYWKQD